MEGHLRFPGSDFLGLMATPVYVVAGLPNSVLASIQVPDDISITEFLPHYVQQRLPAAKSF